MKEEKGVPVEGERPWHTTVWTTLLNQQAGSEFLFRVIDIVFCREIQFLH